jgi:aminoglycoside phosphotransferase (APT) family kinase protein
LHEKQILITGGHLVGLLDFGDAAIGTPAWDVASFGYFHGWRLARVLLTGYTPDEWLRHRLLTEARSFAFLIALHHASRSVSLQRPQRMRDAIQFLRRTLAAPGWD